MIVKPIKNDFNLYKNFYFVAKVGSISGAANELFISQPTVSYNIKKLEYLLDCKLFIRTSKGIILTEDGKSVLDYIETAYNSILLAERSIVNNKNLQTGLLNIGGASFLINGFLLDTIGKFCKKYPKIRVNIISKSTKELTNYLSNNKIDILLETLPITGLSEDAVVKNLFKKKTCFACCKKVFEEYKKDKMNIPFLVPDLNSDIGKDLLKNLMLKESDFKYKQQMQFTSTEVMLNLCKRGVGIGYFMVDYINEELRNGEMFVIEPELQTPEIDIVYCYIEHYLNYSAKEFLKMLKEV